MSWLALLNRGAGKLFLIAALVLAGAGLSACSDGDAREPAGAPASSGFAPAGTGGSGGVSTSSSTIPGTDSTPPNDGTLPEVAQNTCDITALNNGRFAGRDVLVVAIVDDGLCPACDSGEFCTTATGSCRCLVLAPKS